MRNKRSLAGLFVMGLVLTGCQNQRTWDGNTGYPSGMQMSRNYPQQPMAQQPNYAQNRSYQPGNGVQQAAYQQPTYQQMQPAGLPSPQYNMNGTAGGPSMSAMPSSPSYPQPQRAMSPQYSAPTVSAQQTTTTNTMMPPVNNYHTAPSTGKVQTMPMNGMDP